MTQESSLRRVDCDYRSENARFLLDCDFSKQYCHYYRTRLEKTRPFLEFNCRSKWSPTIPIHSLDKLASFADTNFDQILSPPSCSSSYTQSIINDSYKLAKRLRRLSKDELDENPIENTSSPKQCFSPKLISESPDLIATTSSLVIKQGPWKEIISSNEASLNADIKTNLMTSELCIIIGTIFKRMKLQPDVLEELSNCENFHINCEQYMGHYHSLNDKLILEDGDESIALTGDINASRFVTGVVVALLGQPIEECTKFLVRDICYPEPNKLLLYGDHDDDSLTLEEIVPEIQKPLKINDGQPMYLMVLTGLEFQHNMVKGSPITKALQNLINFVWGAEEYSDDDRSCKVARLLVIGNNLAEERLYLEDQKSSQGNDEDEDDIALKMKRSRQLKPKKNSIKITKNLDDFFAELSKTIHVQVMPGPSDPTTHLMPQQPFHPCIFPKSSELSTFTCLTNPHHGIYDDDVEILATSGQNLDIIDRFSSISDPIEIMKHNLMWGNMAPSAPDNLYTAPYADEDPMIIDFIPDIYIAGCQEYYRTETYYYKSNEPNQSYLETCVTGQASNDEMIEHSSQKIEEIKSDKSISDTNRTSEQEEEQKQEQEAASRKESTLLITVPKFSETYSCVLINLKNLDSQLVTFR